jgi:DNA-directed RNA polymerase sigma subunit (sigma70/sigma32)
MRRKGLSFNQIAQDLGIGSERARQIVRKYQHHLKLLEDPFAL